MAIAAIADGCEIAASLDKRSVEGFRRRRLDRLDRRPPGDREGGDDAACQRRDDDPPDDCWLRHPSPELCCFGGTASTNSVTASKNPPARPEHDFWPANLMGLQLFTSRNHGTAYCLMISG